MTATEFATLSMDVKCNLIWVKGRFLANYVENKAVFNLYLFQYFLVEIGYSPSTAQVNSVVVLDPPALDTLYYYVRQLVLPLDDASAATAA